MGGTILVQKGPPGVEIKPQDGSFSGVSCFRIVHL